MYLLQTLFSHIKMKPVDTVCNGSKKLSTHWCSLKLAQFAGSPPCNHAVSTADFWEWWTLGNGWESISIELQSPAVSIRALAGSWWVICPERDLFDQWPHLIMCPLFPFIKVTTANGVASNIYIKPGLQVASKNRNYYFALQFCKHVKAKVWERNECANEYFCWNIHNKVLFAWT